MSASLSEQFDRFIQGQDPNAEKFAVDVVDFLLGLASDSQASDLHLIPHPHSTDATKTQLLVLARMDGVLQQVGVIGDRAENVIARLKVQAGLLTYRTDVPQEGRLKQTMAELEIRVSIFPTIHGEKAVVRLFVGSGGYQSLEDLGLPNEVLNSLRGLLSATSGLGIVCGPAGSGKTTTLYASLREIRDRADFPKSLCTLEDPVEAVLDGVSQSQVKPGSDFDFEHGLKSLMRQDPEVIMVGEIRDRETARVAFQTSLTGHLVLSSFHAGNAADAVSRLLDMSIEPYVLRSGLIGVLAQRLLRQSCGCESGCEKCRHTSYRGRLAVAEFLDPNQPGLRETILSRSDARAIYEAAITNGMTSILESARAEVASRRTTAEEFRRVFGLSVDPTYA